MTFFGNTTTARLEAFARARGLTLGIVKSPGNAAGLFFVASVDGRPLARWQSLGWSADEARQNIEERAVFASGNYTLA